jgi:hypothetical protein
MTTKKAIEIAHDDVLAAWAILENLAVSFDQIGAVFGRSKHTADDPKQQKTLQAALAAYVTPTLVQEINDARMRLGQYVPDEEAAALAEQIAYWDYADLPDESSNAS